MKIIFLFFVTSLLFANSSHADVNCEVQLNGENFPLKKFPLAYSTMFTNPDRVDWRISIWTPNDTEDLFALVVLKGNARYGEGGVLKKGSPVEVTTQSAEGDVVKATCTLL